jgi:hypothetical protein
MMLPVQPPGFRSNHSRERTIPLFRAAVSSDQAEAKFYSKLLRGLSQATTTVRPTDPEREPIMGSSNTPRILVAKVLAAHIGPGDEIAFPLAIDSVGARTELNIRKSASSRRSRDLYQATCIWRGEPFGSI